MKKVLLSMILLLLVSGCVFIEKKGVSDEDTRIPFTTYYNSYTYVDDIFSCGKTGINSETLIQTEDEYNVLKEKYFKDVILEEVDFNEYLLYVNFIDAVNDFVKGFKVVELAYNEDNFVVFIDQEDGEIIYNKDNKIACYFDISKIKKEDFPNDYHKDWIRIPKTN